MCADLTADKKLKSMRWEQPDKLSVNEWILKCLDVMYLELSTVPVIAVN